MEKKPKNSPMTMRMGNLREAGYIKRLAGMLIAVFILWIGSLPVHAVSRNLTFETLGLETDVKVSAPHSSISFDFPVPRLAQVQSATATFFITPNAQLNGDTIFFFYFNDKLIETRTAKEIRQQKNLILKLPVDGVAREFARIKIKSGMFITDDLCRDYHSGGLLFTVHRNTFLNLTYGMMPVHTVQDFFGSFQQTLILVVPDNATMEEYAPGAWIYGLLKKAHPDLDIQFVRAAELVKLPPVPRIWIGLETKLPGYFKGAAPGITLVDPNTLLISAADLPSLRSYAKQIPDLPIFSVDPTAGRHITIAPAETNSGLATEAIAFGNNNDQEGILSVLTDFQIFPALMEKIPERMGLHLEGSHSAAVDSARPVRMDVILNSQLVYSSALDQSGRFKRDILLPELLELRSRNDLKIQFNYPEETGLCRERGKILSAQIFPSSYMWGGGQYRINQFSWSNIGLLFGRQGTILFDEALGTNTLKIAGELSYFLNRQLPPGTNAFPDYMPLSLRTEAPEGAYILAAGITGNIPAALQDQMPTSLGKDFTVYRKGTQNALFEHQANMNSVLGQIGEIKGIPLVILSANLDGGQLHTALRFLGRIANYDDLTGNVFVFQQQNQLYTFDVRERSVKSEKPAANFIIEEFWEQNRTPLLITAGVSILLILIIFAFRQMFPRKRMKKETERSNQSDKLFK